MRRLALLAVAFLMLAQSGTHTIRVAMNADAGQRVKATEESHVQQSLTVRALAGNVMKTSTRSDDDLEEWTSTTVRRAGTNATFRRTWTKAEHTTDGKRFFSPLQGQTVTFMVRGENVGVMASDGAPITEDARQNVQQLERSALHAEANNYCVPPSALANGATWTIAADQARDCFVPLGTINGPVTASGKLTSIENGYAIIDFKFAMKLTSFGTMELVSPAPLDGTMRLRVSLTDPLDWTGTRSMHLVGTFRPPGENESLTTDMRVTGTARSSRG
ncbi:MAG TPA: hypothetical protein VII75_03415 [Thermoanaerobaculia bacterium]|nr:hypothetical protein [Thermoanaerobaculia bacterium]